MKNYLKQTLALCVLLVAGAACDNGGIPMDFANPFPQDAAAYHLAYDSNNKNLLVDFPFQVDENLQKLSTIIQFNEDGSTSNVDLSEPNADGEFDFAKLLFAMQFKVDKNKPDKTLEDVQECYTLSISNENHQVQCVIHFEDSAPFQATGKIAILSSGSAKFSEDITAEGVTLKAGKEAQFAVYTPELDLSLAQTFAGDEANAQKAAVTAAAVGTPGNDQITLNGKKYNCTGSGANLSCSETSTFSSQAHVSVNSGGACNLSSTSRTRNLAGLLYCSVFGLAFVVARRKQNP